MKLEVRQRSRFARLPLPHNRRAHPCLGGQVPVQAALGDVELRSLEKARLRQLPRKKLFGGPSPDEIHGLFAPEQLRLLERQPIERLVLGVRLNSRVLGELRARQKSTFFLQA